MDITPPATHGLPPAPLVIANIPSPEGLQLGHMPENLHPWVPHASGALCHVVQSVVGEVGCSIAIGSIRDRSMVVLHAQERILSRHIPPAQQSS